MLRNCFLPVNYNKTPSRTCGEIVYQSFDEFIINCTLCKIKIFEFQEFVTHLKNVHLEELIHDGTSSTSKKELNCTKILHRDHEEEEEDYYFDKIIKSEDETNSIEGKLAKTDCQDLKVSDDCKWADEHINKLSDEEVEEYLFLEDNDHQEEDEEEEPVKSIIRKNRKPKEYTCEICNKKYADERRLHMHIKILHLREKPFKCTYCDQSFAEQRSLQNHIGHKHTGYDCPTCHKNFSSSRNLKRHMHIHAEVKEFLCPEESCGKAFASKGLLKDHQRCHSGENFICEECGYKCRQRESLIVHKRHHTGEKPFACKQCDSRFGSKPLLKEHMATHETERNHVCDVCGKSFNRPKALYHHKHLHLGIKKFVCKTCGAAYAQAAGLSAHMRKHKEVATAFTNELSSPTNQANILNVFYNL